MLSPSTPLLPVRARRLRQARLSKRKQVACVYKKPGEQRKSDSRHSEAAGDRRDTGEKSHKELRRYSIISQIFFLFILFSLLVWLVVPEPAHVVSIFGVGGRIRGRGRKQILSHDETRYL